MTTINDISDLIRILRDDPAWGRGCPKRAAVPRTAEASRGSRRPHQGPSGNSPRPPTGDWRVSKQARTNSGRANSGWKRDRNALSRVKPSSRLPSTAYKPPSTACRPPLMECRPPSTACRPPSMECGESWATCPDLSSSGAPQTSQAAWPGGTFTSGRPTWCTMPTKPETAPSRQMPRRRGRRLLPRFHRG